MADLVDCLSNLIVFDIPLLYYYTNLNLPTNCCLFSRDIYLSFDIQVHCKLYSFVILQKIFLKHLLFYQLFYYQLNHRFFLFFLITLFEAVFISSAVDCLALSIRF